MISGRLFRLAVLTLGLGFIIDVAQAQTVGHAAASSAGSGRVQCVGTTSHENTAAVARTNEIRRAQGLGQLRPNPRLAEAAARHACDMAQRRQMTHTGSTTRGPSQRVKAVGYKTRIVAENIGMGFDQAEEVMAAWALSRGHLTNILLPQVRDFGIGKAVGADGRVYWAAVYAADR